jgi:hypothetical protein
MRLRGHVACGARRTSRAAFTVPPDRLVELLPPPSLLLFGRHFILARENAAAHRGNYVG